MKRRRSKKSKSQSSKGSSKSIGDDPLGKRFSLLTGEETDSNNYKDIDLLEHNDVFFSDEVNSTEDSFGIEFAHSVNEPNENSFSQNSHVENTDSDIIFEESASVVRNSKKDTDRSTSMWGTTDKGGNQEDVNCSDHLSSSLSGVNSGCKSSKSKNPTKLVGKLL